MCPKPSLHHVPQTSAGEYLGPDLYGVTTQPGLCLTLTSVLLSHITSSLICLHQALICSRYSSTPLASPHLTAIITISAKSHTIAPSLSSPAQYLPQSSLIAWASNFRRSFPRPPVTLRGCSGYVAASTSLLSPVLVSSVSCTLVQPLSSEVYLLEPHLALITLCVALSD